MKKATKETMSKVITRLKKYNDQMIKELYAPMPVFLLHTGIYALVAEILEVEEISEELQKRIGRILGKEWMRRGIR